jgi:hypothetical protein
VRAVTVFVGLAVGLSVSGAVLTGCDVKYDCQDCNVKLDVPFPDCVVYKNGEISRCPDAGDAGDDADGGPE